MNITKNTLVVSLTVEQFLEVLDLKKEESVIKKDYTQKKYVYGLKGIRTLFKVSHATAQKYKDTILKDAISQQGRKIIVDVERAMELFTSKKDE